MILSLLEEAVRAGAREEKACEELGLSARTVQRWRARQVGDDARRGPTTTPANTLSAAERAEVLAVLHRPEHHDASPQTVVAKLADEGQYVASESTMYRLLREASELTHRGRARPPVKREAPSLRATGPNQIWSWDITYLLSPVRGVFFYLYLIVDIWSRRIMGWAVHTEESQEHAAALIEKAARAAGVDPGTLALHSDNGGPMRGGTMLAMLSTLGIRPSFSRPRVSDDNPFSEALFRTLKYVPQYPRKPFEGVVAACLWVEQFVRWYNVEHLHSGIGFVTPEERHTGHDVARLEGRRRVYEAAREAHPERWSGGTRAWSRPTEVTLNAKDHKGSKKPKTPQRQGRVSQPQGAGLSAEVSPRLGHPNVPGGTPPRTDPQPGATPRYGAVLKGIAG